MKALHRVVRRNARISGLFDLIEFQLNRRGTTEDRDRNPHFVFLVVDLFHCAIEVSERAFSWKLGAY
jgi:hypothetical protein